MNSQNDSCEKRLIFDIISEEEMHRDPYLCYLNRTTPIEKARLFDRFYREEMRHDSQFHEFIAASMMSGQTGLDHLPAPLMHTDAILLTYRKSFSRR